ncbi:MAG: translation initiation factor IF-5A [Candidatus Nanohaloarchaeota archaeon]|nr:translation initiation factor IF-5A [Candidatus Nanohaloarchaeota archaeon]
MEVIMKEAKQFRKGDFIMIDDVPCRVVDISLSKPGKHGSAKARIVAVGIIDGKKREISKPGDSKIPAPIIDKRDGQVITVSDDQAQIMDLETYEVFDALVNEELKGKLTEGVNVEYWVIAGTVKMIMRVKGE